MSDMVEDRLHPTIGDLSKLHKPQKKVEEALHPLPLFVEIPSHKPSAREEKYHIVNEPDDRTSTSPQREIRRTSRAETDNNIELGRLNDAEGDLLHTTRSSRVTSLGYATKILGNKSSHNHTRSQIRTSPSNRPLYLMPPSGPVRLFVASLGNPTPYQNTRHSAGHVLLKGLQSYLSLPPLSKTKGLAGGYVSLGSDVGQPQYTLWQSPSLMNISGVNLLKAYKTFLSTLSSDETDALVVLHDEMETTPGQIKLRRGPTSPKGHNGIKSVQQSLQGAGLMDRLTKNNGGRFLKVAVGIGRPEGGTRDKDDVSAYVLGQLRREEKEGIEGCVADLVGMLDAEVAKMGSN